MFFNILVTRRYFSTCLKVLLYFGAFLVHRSTVLLYFTKGARNRNPTILHTLKVKEWSPAAPPPFSAMFARWRARDGLRVSDWPWVIADAVPGPPSLARSVKRVALVAFAGALVGSLGVSPAVLGLHHCSLEPRLTAATCPSAEVRLDAVQRAVVPRLSA